ncbi:MAG TPA: RNA methyltransferase [Planctomycetota bacterium]|nr:RNA methyltransferase [Planctomycetota bacterium]
MSDPAPITSAKNPIVARFRAAATGDAPDLFLVEGRKLIAEALDAKLAAVEAAYDADRLAPGEELLARLRRAGARVTPCAPSVCARLSSVSTPQGIAAVFRRPVFRDEDLLGRAPALVVVAAGVKEPGNLGALVRAAEAAGAGGVLALRGGADPFRDKAVRGAAGSSFRLPVRGGVPVADALAFVVRYGLRLFVLAEDGEVDYLDADLREPCAVALGGEGEGLPDELRAAAAACVRVPMAGRVDSLNVAVAAGVVLYEARRQRR